VKDNSARRLQVSNSLGEDKKKAMAKTPTKTKINFCIYLSSTSKLFLSDHLLCSHLCINNSTLHIYDLLAKIDVGRNFREGKKRVE
jgi:hypothetical protein